MFETQKLAANDPLAVGTPVELVFDDEPLGPMLSGATPAEPTSASVLQRWQQGHDRSAACARALVAVLVKNPDAISQVTDLDSAEQSLRGAVESKPQREGLELAACLGGLGRVLELKQKTDEAERVYRQALEIQEKLLGAGHEVTFTTGLRLVHLLEQSNRKDEATRLRNQFEAQRLIDKEDDSNLWRLRSVALDMFLAGHYADAEAAYRRLAEKRFESGSTHCHLARLFLMTDRDAKARQEVDHAWEVRHESPAYVILRTHYLRTLLLMLAGEDWKSSLLEVKASLASPDAHMDWSFQPVLDHLKPRLGQELFDLMTAVVTAVNQRTKLPDLESNPLWIAECGSGESSAAAANEVISSVVHAPGSAEFNNFVSEAPQSDNADKFTFGTIVRAADHRVVVREYDFALDSDVEREYGVNDETELGNLSGLDQLVPGESVVLDYTESNGQRLIRTIVKEPSHGTVGENPHPE
jgi:tetratricopeptide (TPR) repeat protein